MSGLRVKYKELFSLSIGQNFYENGICRKYAEEPSPDIMLMPAAECEELMKRMDLVYKENKRVAGGTVLARVSGQAGNGNELLRFKAKKGDKLSFYMILKNPDMPGFNDLPVQQDRDRIYYFSNQQNDILAPRNNLHLTNAAAGVNAATDATEKTGAIYRFHSAVAVSAGNTFVKHLLSGVKAEPRSIINHNGQADLIFDLSSLSPGKCELWIDDDKKEEFYFLKDNLSSPVFGVIEIVLLQNLGNNYNTVETDQSLQPAPPQYKILFLRRKTLWRYTVHLSPEKAGKPFYLTGLKIKTNDGTVSFSQISASDTDLVFVSDNALYLKERYFSSDQAGELLSLKLEKSGVVPDPAMVSKTLSYPFAGHIDATNLPNIYSDILINL